MFRFAVILICVSCLLALTSLLAATFIVKRQSATELVSVAEHIKDPADWLVSKVKHAIKASTMGAKGRISHIPDPAEWLAAHYLHDQSPKSLADEPRRHPAMAVQPRPHATEARQHTLLVAPHALLARTQMLTERHSLDAARSFPHAPEVLSAMRVARAVGCGSAVHEETVGGQLLVEPCSSRAEQFRHLKQQRFTRHGDRGTLASAARPDLAARQFRRQDVQGVDLAAAADSAFLTRSPALAAAAAPRLTVSDADAGGFTLADQADNIFLGHKIPATTAAVSRIPQTAGAATKAKVLVTSLRQVGAGHKPAAAVPARPVPVVWHTW